MNECSPPGYRRVVYPGGDRLFSLSGEGGQTNLWNNQVQFPGGAQVW